jgi:4-hydroxy-3-methylbut-2-enyl diphosphate reductase
VKARFGIWLAEHYGMCFGVRDALAVAERVAGARPATVLGELVHNEVVQERLRRLGARTGDLNAPAAETRDVILTAHGASDRDRDRWRDRGYAVTDTTCPLVRKAHLTLAKLVAEGCLPVIIGKAGHVEVRGLAGDFPSAQIVLTDEDIEALPFAPVIGVVSQTTQAIDFVESLVGKIRRRHPKAKVVFRDTVCQPTKNRQKALRDLCLGVELVIVVGGINSNNTWQLVEKARRCGCRAERVGSAAEVKEQWLYGTSEVGVTAGTSTLQETVEEVVARLEALGGERIAQEAALVERGGQ